MTRILQELPDTEFMELFLTIPGKPEGKGRPRVVRKNGKVWTFTPKQTELAETEIRRHWEQAGQIRFHDDDAIALDITLFVERPASHFTTTGLLSASGHRHPIPRNRKPDIDNALKLVMDALNTRAWKDDVQVAKVTIERVWAEEARTEIYIRPLTDGLF